jgi:hypothetical protein
MIRDYKFEVGLSGYTLLVWIIRGLTVNRDWGVAVFGLKVFAFFFIHGFDETLIVDRHPAFSIASGGQGLFLKKPSLDPAKTFD